MSADLFRKAGSSIDCDACLCDTLSIWDIPPEKARDVGHPAPFPVELPKRLIELGTYTGDVVIDIFGPVICRAAPSQPVDLCARYADNEGLLAQEWHEAQENRVGSDFIVKEEPRAQIAKSPAPKRRKKSVEPPGSTPQLSRAIGNRGWLSALGSERQDASRNPSSMPRTLRVGLEQLSGIDLSNVRVHRNSYRPAQLDALAFTEGQEIHLAPRQERHLAHEGWHAVQQLQDRVAATNVDGRRPPINDDQHLETEADVMGARALQMPRAEYAPRQVRGPGAPEVVQCQSASPAAATQPQTPQVIARSDENQWVRTVDDAVRQEFGLRGTRMTPARVGFLSEADFAAAFPAASVEDTLVDLFLSPFGIVHSVLRAHQVSLASPTRIREFVRERIAQGSFNISRVVPPRGMDTASISPTELLARVVGGVTDVAPTARTRRRVSLQQGQSVELLVHEACHFYISNGFKRLAAVTPNRGHLQRGAGIEHTLMEGFAELFARRVMRNHQMTLGPGNSGAYEFQVGEAIRFSATVGAQTAEDAYFRGDRQALAVLRSALQTYETTHPDLIAPWP